VVPVLCTHTPQPLRSSAALALNPARGRAESKYWVKAADRHCSQPPISTDLLHAYGHIKRRRSGTEHRRQCLYECDRATELVHTRCDLLLCLKTSCYLQCKKVWLYLRHRAPLPHSFPPAHVHRWEVTYTGAEAGQELLPGTLMTIRKRRLKTLSHSPASFSGMEVTQTSFGPLICPRQGAEAQMIKHSAFLQQKCYRSL